MSRNLLKSLNLINFANESEIASVKSAMEERLDFLSDREPESDGSVHDLWDEKYSAIEEIIDYLDEYESAENDEEREEAWDSAKEAIEDYHITYGGLSRIKI